MKRRPFILLALTVSVGVSGVEAQEIRRALPVNAEPAPTPEVRRAEPVNLENYENPAWMDRVPRAEPVPAPEPVEPPQPEAVVPVATPAAPEVRVAEPVETPPTPEPAPTPMPTPPEPEPPGEIEPDPDGTIRLSPTMTAPEAGASRSLVAANGFYRRQMYDMAVIEYEKFLISDPQAAGRDGALFRLAESHRFLGNDRAAREGYQRLLAEVNSGEFAGAGAFRLGEIFFAGGSYGAALEMFRKALANSREPEVKLTAEFFAANSLDKLNRPTEALVAFESIAKQGGENPYREDARFFVAEALSKSDRKGEALNAFEELGSSASKPAMQAEALVKAAALAAEMNETDRANKLFASALAHPEIGSWRGVARLGLLRIAYQREDYATAAAISEDEIASLPEDAQSEAILIAANSNRQLGNKTAALEGYDRVIAQFPRSDAALRAKFQRLVTLDSADAGGFIKELDQFIVQSTNPRERAQAQLMKAEALFNAGNFADAAPLYGAVGRSDLPTRLKEQALYKLGWSQSQTGDHAAAQKSYNEFLRAYPKSDLAASAQAQLALSFQRSEQYADAVKAFDKVLKDHPDAKERELILQQKALTLGQLEDFPGMVATFEQFLKEFPESQVAAQAYFWIGWAKFENKDFPGAIEALKKARELDPDQYTERATLRIVLAHYYGEDRDAVAAEADNLSAEALPAEVVGWLATGYYAAGDYTNAEKFLAPVVAAADRRPVEPEVYLQLARARIALEKFGAAEDPVARFLATARDPSGRARGLLLQSEIALAKGELDTADRLIEETLLLQPEGRLNAEGRMMHGRALARRGRSEDAARAFATVAILYDDKTITPEALRLASESFAKAGNSSEAEKMRSELRHRFPDAVAN